MRFPRARFSLIAFVLAIWLAMALTPPLLAQSSVAADLDVYVQDQSGAYISNAQLTITQVDTGVSRTGITDNSGRYRFTALAIGTYRLNVKKDGFASYEQRDITLHVGELVTLHTALKLASVEQQETVSAEDVPIVQPERTTIGGVVPNVEVDNLPINGRDFLDFSTTVAGVTPQQTSGQGSGLSFNGQRGRSNNILIDGVENNGQLNGDVRSTISLDAVQEFRVVTDQYAAEFGGAGGGLVNVVTKSGTNAYHGDVFYFARDASMDAYNAFVPAGQKPPYTRKDSGLTLGGPIFKNKTFFFGSLEYTSTDQSGITTISNSNVAAVNAALAARPIPGSGVTSISNGVFPVGEIQTLGSFRVDHHFDDNNSLTFRYLYGQNMDSNAGGVAIGGLTDVTGGGGDHMRDNSFLGDYVHIFSPSMLSETRFQYARQDLSQYSNDLVGPHVTISGVANFGRNVNFPVLLNETHKQFQESFSYSHGNHFIKFGTDIDNIQANTSFPVDFAGSFTFANLNAFLAGTPSTFVQGFGDPQIHLPETLLAFYVQDSYKITPRLTLNYGLRYDYDMQPQGIQRDPANPIEAPLQSGIPRDGNNFGPRVGIAYSVDRSGQTVVRAGYGIFYDKIFLLVARNTLLARQTVSLTGAAAAAQFAAGAFPESNQYPTGVSVPKGSINLVPNNFVTPYAQQANLSVDRAIGNNWHVALNYVYVHGVHMLKSANANLLPPTILTAANAASLGVKKPNAQQIGRYYYGSPRVNTAFTNIQEDGTWGGSNYNALQVSVERRLRHGMELRGNYTYSKDIDDASDFTQAMQPDNPYDPGAERSVSDEDMRHRFTATGVWQLPYKRKVGDHSIARWVLGDWVSSSILTLHSGSPLNIHIGSDANGDSNSSSDRPFINGSIVGRNALRGPRVETVDLRMEKRIPIREGISLDFLGEAFNLFNHVNYTGVNTVWGTGLTPTSSFGEFTSAGAPREIQLGLKLYF